MSAHADATPADLSAYYTPSSTAACLASWAIRFGHEKVLEPSFGGGALIEAVEEQARLTGRPQLKILGFDLDSVAVKALRNRYERSTTRLLRSDFLDVDPEQHGAFDVVISNPPFTRNHAISAKRRAELKHRFGITGAAGLWVHFILHSMQFLRVGGRLAFVVPASSFFADYAKPVLDKLCSSFRTVELLRLNEKPQWTGGAQEAGAFLLADGYLEGSCPELARGFWVAGRGQVGDFDLPNPAFAKLLLASQTLEDIANVGIGDVTGCNRVFLLSSADLDEDAIPRAQLTPVVSRSRHICGLLVTKKELARLANEGEKTWLLLPTDIGRQNKTVRRRLARISAAKRKSTVWLNKRDPWWKVTTGLRCDAVFSYMNDQGPRLARVSPGVRCTNTLHCVSFKPQTTELQEISAMLTMISSFGQLAAERLGRVYGGGVLKFEIRETRRLPVLPISNGADLNRWIEVDEALRCGDRDAATALANRMLIAPLLGTSWQEAVESFDCELRERRRARRGGKSSSG